MAADDLFHLEFCVRTPEGYASSGLYYMQSNANDGYQFSTHALCDAWVENCVPLLRAMLSDDVDVQGVRARQVHSDAAAVYDPAHLRTASSGAGSTAGLIAAPALPSILPLILTIVQSANGAKGNGRIFVSGIPEDQTTGNSANGAYLDGVVQAFCDSLGLTDATALKVTGDTAEFKLGVLSAKGAYAPIQSWIDGGQIGPKPGRDYGGAFVDATQVFGNALISKKKLRATKVWGGATLSGA